MRHKKNITLNLQSITSHFTGSAKIITLVFIIIMLSLVNITFTSALSYQNSVGVGFTFDPTLSVNISPSDLTISNLSPGTTADSNIINVSVATNATYGYTLSTNVNNESLVHSNNINTFNSIATDADLSDLDDSEDTNIWGYSTSLDSGTTWSNYNGLSSSNSTTLLDANSNVSSNLDFKIAAKASGAQPSGTYTGTINFTAVSNVAPMSLLDSFIASGAEQLNGYFKMQDMTHDICSNVDIEESELQLIDIRDNKIYWVAKLRDGNCWMTQNLDLDLDSDKTYTHWDTDLGWNTENNNTINENATWSPANSTISFSGTRVDGWIDSDTEPYSADPGDIYFYTSNSTANDIKYTSTQNCINAGHNDCAHYHTGNYYNHIATTTNNNINSICSKGWKLPDRSTFSIMLTAQYVYTGSSNVYLDDGFNKLRISPLYYARFGRILYGSTNSLGTDGFYWQNNERLWFYNSNIWVGGSGASSQGFSVRCVAR